MRRALSWLIFSLPVLVATARAADSGDQRSELMNDRPATSVSTFCVG